ncbi:hypothetical protein ACOSP7_030061 [Xanthoceras sorbifolium]
MSQPQWFTAITTIHQPSSRMFHMFDKLLLISEGYPLYYGKLERVYGVHWHISSAPDSDRTVIKYLQLKYKTQLEPKEKEENHRNRMTPEDLQLAMQVKKSGHCLSGSSLLWRKSQTGAEAQLRDHFHDSLQENIFMVIVYFMAGFKRTVPCFFLTLFSILLIPVTSQGAGELFGAASTNAQVLLLDDIVHQKFRFGALEFHDLLQICFNDNKHFVLLIFVSGI